MGQIKRSLQRKARWLKLKINNLFLGILVYVGYIIRKICREIIINELSKTTEVSDLDALTLRCLRDNKLLRDILLRQIERHQKTEIIKIDNDSEDDLGMTLYGPLVVEVVQNSKADLSGIKIGDVVMKINGVPIWNSRSRRLYLTDINPKGRLELKVRQLPAGEWKSKTCACKAKRGTKWMTFVERIRPCFSRLLDFLGCPWDDDRDKDNLNNELLEKRFRISKTSAHLISFVKFIQCKRNISIKREPEENFGFRLMGAFIVEVEPDSDADKKGIRVGDQITNIYKTTKDLTRIAELPSRFKMRTEDYITIASFPPYDCPGVSFRFDDSKTSAEIAATTREFPDTVVIEMESDIEVINEEIDSDTETAVDYDQSIETMMDAESISWRSNPSTSESSSRSSAWSGSGTSSFEVVVE